MKRKLISSLLCLCMLVSLIPVAAFAAGEEATVSIGGKTQTVTGKKFTATAADKFTIVKSGDDGITVNSNNKYGYYPAITMPTVADNAKANTYYVLSRGTNNKDSDLKTVMDAALAAFKQDSSKKEYTNTYTSIADWFQVYPADEFAKANDPYWPQIGGNAVVNVTVVTVTEGTTPTYAYDKYTFDFSAATIEMPIAVTVPTDSDLTTTGKTVAELQSNIKTTVTDTAGSKTISVTGTANYVNFPWFDTGKTDAEAGHEGNYVALKIAAPANADTAYKIKSIEYTMSDGTTKGTLDDDGILIWELKDGESGNLNYKIPLKVSFVDKADTASSTDAKGSVTYYLDLSNMDLQEAKTGTELSIEPAAGTILNKAVADIQTNVNVAASGTTINVTGTSKYVVWPDFSSVDAQKSGHYVALKFNAAPGATIKVTGSNQRPDGVTLDADRILVTRLENVTATPKVLTVEVTNGQNKATYTINLNLTQEAKPALPTATLQYTSVADKSIVSDCAPDTMWLTFASVLPKDTNLWFVITNDKNAYVYGIGATTTNATTTKLAWSFQNKGQFEKWAKDAQNADVALGTTAGATYTVKGYEINSAPTSDTTVPEGTQPFATWTVTVPALTVVVPGDTTVKDSLPAGIEKPKADAAKAAAATVQEDITDGSALSVAAADQGAKTEAPTKTAVDKAIADAKITAIAEADRKIVQQPALNVEVKDYKTVGDNNILEMNIAAVLNVVVTNKSVADSSIQVPAEGKTANAAIVSTNSLTVNSPIDLTVTLPADFMTFPTGATTTSIYVKHVKNNRTHYHVATVDANKEATFTSSDGLSPFSFESKADIAASNERTGTYYATLQEAVAEAANNDTIVLQKQLTGDAAKATVTLSAAKTLNFKNASGSAVSELDINGVKVTVNSTTAVSKTFPKNTSEGGGGGGVSSNVTIDRPTNGKVSVTPTAPSKGATVTINLTPDTGYAVGTVTVTDKDGKAVELTKVSDTKYTFTMPDGKVKVAATFTKVDTPPATGFTDVAADAYYADAVKWAVEKGITNGLTATTFGPNNSCTRAQMVTFLWRGAGSPAPTGTNSFTDVASGEYYYNAVLWAVEKGITNGTTDTTFSPNATVNRAQTVTFLYRYAGSPAATGDNAFTDVAAGQYYTDAVKWAVAEEITNGTSATTFAPNNNCTRGQIVTFLYRQMAE